MRDRRFPITPREMEQFFVLTDTLSNLPLCRLDDGLRILLEGACELIGADDAFWIAAVHRPRAGNLLTEAFNGWMPVRIVSLDEGPERHALRRLMLERSKEGLVDPFTRELVSQAGSDRALLRGDVLAPEQESKSWMQRDVFAPGLLHDRMVGASSLADDTETYLGFDRTGDKRRFGPRERDLMRLICIGLKWFFAALHRSHGLVDARETLTAREREVLLQLLTDKGEKTIADELGMRPKTLHHHVTTLYRKFGVNSRPGLMALWLNYRRDTDQEEGLSPTASADQPIVPL